MSLASKYRNWLERQKTKRELLELSIKDKEEYYVLLEKEMRLVEKAREIIREVGLQTQEQLQYHISDIVSLALEAIFKEDAYQLSVEFVQRRNKTECDLSFVRDEDKLDPLDSTGGGAVDTAAFALRVAAWELLSPKARPVIILDEPFRFLDESRQPLASAMIKELSTRLGLQFIIVTHEQSLKIHADKTFVVTLEKRKSDKISIVTEIT